MQNVHPMKVEWPCYSMKNGKEKPQFIKANKEAFRRRLILEDQNLVLLRRFSAKEQQRRLTAAPLIKGKIGSDLIGLENHVNYIYRPKGKLSKKLALGLSVFLNSSLLDRYFRISNGNTQVSATEIRAMPLPSLEVIEEVGDGVNALADIPTLAEIDNLVWSKINKGKMPCRARLCNRIYKFSRIQKAHRRNCMGNGSLVVRDSGLSNSLQRRKIYGSIWIKHRKFILTFLEMIWRVIEAETLNRSISQASSSIVNFLSALGSNNKNTEQAVELRFEYHRISDIAKLRIDSSDHNLEKIG